MKFLSKKQNYIPLNDKIEKFTIIISTLNSSGIMCVRICIQKKKVSEFYYAKIRDTCILHSTLKMIGHA